MTQVMYSIKEAAKELGVEAHALRFWEEELELQIARNEQGRRMYSQENMKTFQKIMDWKKQGMQLKEIKALLHKANTEKVPAMERRILVYRPKEYLEQNIQQNSYIQEAETERAEKARRLQELLKQFIAESIKESQAEFLEQVKENLIKELDYQFRLQEEREEQRDKLRIEKEDEHFRQLDEHLRNTVEKKGKKKRKWFL